MIKMFVLVAAAALLAGCNNPSGSQIPAPPVPVPAPPVQVTPVPTPAPAPQPVPAPPAAPAPVKPEEPEPAAPPPEPTPVVVPPPPPPPPLTSPSGEFATRELFLTWAATTAQAIVFDYQLLHGGFGPPAQFWTQRDGSVSMLPPQPVDPEEPPQPEAVVEAYVPPEVYKSETLAPYVVGVSGVGPNSPEVTMKPGVIYTIPIVLPITSGLYEWSMCEYRGEPAPHTARLSLEPGVLDRPYTDYNLTPSILIEVNANGPYYPGSTVYVVTCVSEPFPRPTPVHYDVLYRRR